MGACATKPKANATDAPPPLPEKDEVEKKELTVAGTVIETKEVAVDADKSSRSLSNLFKEVTFFNLKFFVFIFMGFFSLFYRLRT